MKVRFWGVRGSIPSPLAPEMVESKIKEALRLARVSDILSEQSIHDFVASLPRSIQSTYGSNTTCLEIRGADNELMIIDGGTGIRMLGNSLMQQEFGQGKGEAYVYMSHTHWDHVQGIPFFVPMFIPGNHFRFISAYADIENRLVYQQVKSHFPVTLEDMAAKREFLIIKEGQTYQTLGGLHYRVKRMIHPGGSYSIRVEENGSSIVFCSDAEFNIHTIENIDQYRPFFENADVLIFDTQYTFGESLQKIDWGHSNSSIAIDIATRFGVKKLVLFHYDPSYSDQILDELHIKAMRYRDMNPHARKLDILTAYEGLEIAV